MRKQGYHISLLRYIFIENIGKNESDRILPFNVWIGISTTVSPNFEIMFTIEVTQYNPSKLRYSRNIQFCINFLQSCDKC